MKEIPLSQSKVALVDDADFEWLSAWKWHAARRPDGRFYAARNDWCGGKNKKVYMHRSILGDSVSDRLGDHRNGDGLDNQRANLRPSTHAQNQHNRKVQSSSSSGIKGASKTGPVYVAKITVRGVTHYLGCFSTAEEAGSVYAAASLVHQGEYSHEARA